MRSRKRGLSIRKDWIMPDQTNPLTGATAGETAKGTAGPVAAGETAKGTAGPAFKTISSQDELDRIIAKRIDAVKSKYEGYDDLKKKAEELDKIKEAQMSELEKAQSKNQKLEEKMAKLKRSAEERSWAAEVASEYKIPPEVQDLIHGATKEEMETKAKALAKALKLPSAPVVRGATQQPAGPASGEALAKQEFREYAEENWT
jgi:myosin heavy subunit